MLPRTGGWVFGCGAGIGDGALALWQLAADDGVDAVWLVDAERDAQDAAALGIPTLRTYSLAGFLATARARVVVVTHGFGDVNRYAVSGAFIVQLWHGIPLKRIGLDSPETLRSGLLPGSRLVRALLGAMYRSAARRIRIIPAASHLVRGRLESAFGLPDTRVVVTGEPRVDVLSAGTTAERRAAGRAGLERAVGALPERVVLYAPTWRDGDEDPAVPDAHDWAEIVDLLRRTDTVLLVRSHPLGAGAYVPPESTDRVRMLGSDVVRDVTPLLPGLTALITDYSSLAFDAGLVPLPVLYLAPDVAAYSTRRGFYGAYRDVAGEDAAVRWHSLLGQLETVLTDAEARDERLARSVALSARFHDFRDGDNTRRVYREIVAQTRSSPSEGTR